MAIGKTIGKQLDHGFPGGYAVQPDQLSRTFVNGSNETVKFGELVKMKDDDANTVELIRATTTEDKIAGIAMRVVKQSRDYLEQNDVGYSKSEAISVMQRGIISVVCGFGTAKYNGKVYYAFQAEDGKPIGFCAEANSNKTIELTNMKFAGEADANGVVAVTIMEKKNA